MIELISVSKRYGGQVLLDAQSFRLLPGERIGIVGPNGAGKTTLLDLIAGDAEPDAGRIVRRKDIRIGYLRQQLPSDAGDTPLIDYVQLAAPTLNVIAAEIHALEERLADPDLPPAESRAILQRLGTLQSTFEHQDGYSLHARAAAALTGLGFDPADLPRPLASFSGGWQMRALLTRALLADPDLLLLDEPSNYLDLPAVEWLRRRLDAFRGTLALVSHDRYLLQSLTTVTLEVAAATLTRYPGPYPYYAAEREKRRALSLAHAANEQKRINEIQKFVDRFRSKATLATRVQSKIKLLERLKAEQTAVVAVHRGAAQIRIPPPPHSGREVLRVTDLAFRYAPDSPPVLHSVSFVASRGEKIALVGPNGAGKTTLLRLIAGQLTPTAGTIHLGHLVTPGYQSQETAGTLPAADTAFQVLRHADPDRPESDLRTILGTFGFSGEAAEKRVSVLSGGERIRLAFARILLRPPNLLLLDEPTTHLDIETREALQAALAEYPGTLLLVSHDVEFVRHLATAILHVLPHDGGVTLHNLTYDEFRAKIILPPAAPTPSQASAPAPAPPAGAGASSAKPPTGADSSPTAPAAPLTAPERQQLRSDLRKLQKSLSALETQIADAESEIESLSALLADPSLPPSDRATHSRRISDLQSSLPPLYADWESLGTRRDALAHRLSLP